MMWLAYLIAAAVSEPKPSVESILPKLFEQLPSVAAVIAVVLIFIRFLEGDRKSNQEFLAQVQREHITSRQETRQTVSENTASLRESVTATQRNSDMLGQLARVIERWDNGRDK
jgi:7-keto-8-aminopelargonate synthetase-like enzyme